MTFLKYFYSEENYKQVCEATSTFPLTKSSAQALSVGMDTGEQTSALSAHTTNHSMSDNEAENSDTQNGDTQKTASEMTQALQAEIVHAFHNSDVRIATYIGDEDTPQDFEKNMLLLVQNCLAGENNAADTAVKIQRLWEQCVSSQEAG